MVAVTSDDKLLALHSRVPLGSLQQRDPVVHLLRRIGVTVQHPVGRDDHECIGSERQGKKEAKTLSFPGGITRRKQDRRPFSGAGSRGLKTAALFGLYAKANLAHFCGVYFMHH